jgi:hypothetical protein
MKGRCGRWKKRADHLSFLSFPEKEETRYAIRGNLVIESKTESRVGGVDVG